jgi:hypothetical protein
LPFADRCLLIAVCCFAAVGCSPFAVYCLLFTVCFLHPYKLFINPLPTPYACGGSFLLMKKENNKHAVWSWEATGALFCFAGGIGAAVLGSLLTASTWILGAPLHPWLHGLGTALLIVTIPLLIFSGYCLDWAERDQNETATQKSRNGGRESLPN